MAVILRLARKGRKKAPFYHLVATDSRNPRDGAFIEQVGYYLPTGDKKLVVNHEAALRWLKVGATTSATVKQLLKRAGVGKQAPADAATAS